MAAFKAQVLCALCRCCRNRFGTAGNSTAPPRSPLTSPSRLPQDSNSHPPPQKINPPPSFSLVQLHLPRVRAVRLPTYPIRLARPPLGKQIISIFLFLLAAAAPHREKHSKQASKKAITNPIPPTLYKAPPPPPPHTAQCTLTPYAWPVLSPQTPHEPSPQTTPQRNSQ